MTCTFSEEDSEAAWEAVFAFLRNMGSEDSYPDSLGSEEPPRQHGRPFSEDSVLSLPLLSRGTAGERLVLASKPWIEIPRRPNCWAR